MGAYKGRQNRIISSIITDDTPPRCWLCGTGDGHMRADLHMAGKPLCPSCWAFQPRGRSAWTRAASALCRALGLDRRTWHECGFRASWLEDAARRHGVTAWTDAPAADAAPAVTGAAAPFAWIDDEVLAAARADLEAMEDEFQRSRVQPTARR